MRVNVFHWMASGTAVSRLQKELKIILRDPVPNVLAQPLSSNLLEWRASSLSSRRSLCSA